LINQSIDQSINQSTNKPTNQSINQPINQPTNQPINQPSQKQEPYIVCQSQTGGTSNCKHTLEWWCRSQMLVLCQWVWARD